MTSTTFFPYRSEAARDQCFSYFDSVAAKQWPVTGEERTIPTTHGETFVRINGPPGAPPIVLLHGVTASSLMWAPNIEELSAQYRTYAIDQIGDFGKSVCSKPLASFSDLVAWLDELFDALKLRSEVSLVGVSYGGALAVHYALHAPGRLNKIVLLAPACTVLRVRASFWARVAVIMITRRRGIDSFFRWIFADMQRNDPKWVDGALDQLRLNMRSLQRRKTPIPPVLKGAEWRKLTVPTLFMAGEHDVIYSAEKAVRRLKRVAPQVTAEVVPNAGHDFTIAHSREIDRRILQFLLTAKTP
jgi:pimeloyl-ACP methyl ester carboxylesterase